MSRDLNELAIFANVAQVHSFTAAARQLGLPKSSVSRAMASLEARLGVRLLERTTRRVALTEAGEIYAQHCQRLLEESEDADMAIGALLATPRGRLRIGAPVMFARAYLAPVVSDLVLTHPDLRVHVELLGNEPLPRHAQLDVLIRPGPLEDSGLLVRPLARIRLGAYASPAYLRGRDVPGSPDALRAHRCITTSCGASGTPSDVASWTLRRGSEEVTVRVDAHVAVPDPAINQQLALAGAGIALLSQTGVRDEVAAGRLVRLLPEWEPAPVELHALYSSRLTRSPKVRAFLQALRERLDQ